MLQALRQPLLPEERQAIEQLVAAGPGPVGDCYSLEREEGGPHSSIMWKNQNTHGAPQDAGAYVPPSYTPPKA